MSISLASQVDLDEAYQLGAEAVRLAAQGESDQMTALRRTSNNPYACEIVAVPLFKVANRVRTLPGDFVGQDNRSVTTAFRDYALPLLGPDAIPRYVRLNIP
jgi:6-phosphofructokinase 1